MHRGLTGTSCSRRSKKFERARHNCPNSELPSSNLDQFFVSPLGGAKKRLGASDLTRGLHGHSCLRVRVGTLELPNSDKYPAKPQAIVAGRTCPHRSVCRSRSPSARELADYSES